MFPNQLAEVTDEAKMGFTSQTVQDNNKRIHFVQRNHFLCFF